MKPGDIVFIFVPSIDLTLPAAIAEDTVTHVDEENLKCSNSWYVLGNTAFATKEEALEQACRYYHSHLKRLELIRRRISDALKE